MPSVRGVLITLETLPWLVLGPLNMVKVAFINKGSPVAEYIVVPPAETCQAHCKIARMWAVLFWGLQTSMALAMVRKQLKDESAALAKLVVGSVLVAAYVEDVVREPVLAAGIAEILCAFLLMGGPFLTKCRKLLRRFGVVAFFVHWICYGLTLISMYFALGAGVDVAAYLKSIPAFGDRLADAMDNIDTTTHGLARLGVAWSCAFATAPLRLVSDLLLTLLIGSIIGMASSDKKKEDIKVD